MRWGEFNTVSYDALPSLLVPLFRFSPLSCLSCSSMYGRVLLLGGGQGGTVDLGLPDGLRIERAEGEVGCLPRDVDRSGEMRLIVTVNT